jgi:hypothetical protein
MQSYFDTLLAKDARGDPEETDDTFRKEHELEFISTWCRVRIDPASKVRVHGADGRILEGDVDKISDMRGTSKKKCTWVDTLWVEEGDSLKSNEFFHEAGISKLVKDHLFDLPTFARGALQTAKLDSKGGRGWLTFLRVPGVELETVVNDLTLEDMKSVMLQVLASICIAQDRIQLKHHDLHLFNVLVHANDTPQQQWSVQTKYGLLHIPIAGMHASIIDYGLSSATDPESGKRLVRLDEDLLTKPKKDEPSDDWGVWGPKLEGDTGYDVAMFVESFVEELFRDRPLNIPKLQVVSSLQELFDIDFTDRGRPMETCVVDWPKVFAVLGGVLEANSSG